MKLLFVTWDGPATNYHETLFVPLLREARSGGDQVRLLQFTWGSEDRTRRLLRLAANVDMQFEACDLSGRLRMLRTAWAILRKGVTVRRLLRTGELDTIMARSIIPGGFIALLHALMNSGFAFIYDADGLSADERVEFSGWSPQGWRYWVYLWMERTAVRRSDVILTRTAKAVQVLQERSGESPEKFVVVTNGKDVRTFTPGNLDSRAATRAQIGVPANVPVVVYVGSIGPQYEPEAIIATFRLIHEREPDTRFLVLTSQTNHEAIRSIAGDLPHDQLCLQQADPVDVPSLLSIADLGIAYRRPSLSQDAVAPIKIAEYLLCGVPVAYTAGVGDLDEQLETETACAIAGPPTPAHLARVAEWFSQNVLPDRDRKRALARSHGEAEFSLVKGAEDYRVAFERVSRGRP